MIDFMNGEIDTRKLANDHLAFINDEYKYSILASARTAFRTYEAEDDVSDAELEETVESKKLCTIKFFSGNVVECLFRLNDSGLITPENFDTMDTSLSHRCIIIPGSFYCPGGYFLSSGCRVSEEALVCHYSTLYPVLLKLRDTYYGSRSLNKVQVNHQLYRDDNLVLDNIIFFDYDKYIIDDYNPNVFVPRVNNVRISRVIIGNQPDYSLYLLWAATVKDMTWADTKKILSETMYNRIDSVLSAATRVGVTELIIGEFGNEFVEDIKNPTVAKKLGVTNETIQSDISYFVVTSFIDLLQGKYLRCFKRVWFATTNENLLSSYRDIASVEDDVIAIGEGATYYE